jgi:hypothetical protein
MRSLPAALTALLLSLSVGPGALRAQTPDTSCRASTPAPDRDLEPAILHYQGSFIAGDRTMTIASELAVSPHPDGGWSVVERARLPRGVAVDSAHLEALTLAPRERVIQQGPMRVALRFANDSATGTAAMADQARPVAVALCGSLVGDGAGAFLVVGRLPLDAHYRATLQHLDVQAAKVSARQLAVVASERVVVPAGSYETWKIEERDGMSEHPAATLWVDKVSRNPVKFSATQGLVTITMELVR